MSADVVQSIGFHAPLGALSIGFRVLRFVVAAGLLIGALGVAGYRVLLALG
jgi:hypothetical protein